MEISREAQEKLARALGGGGSDDHPEDAASTAEDVTTLGRIARIIEDVSGVDKESVTADSDLSAGLDLSSLSLIEVAVKMEDALRVRLEDEDIWSARTVGDLVALADARV
ncbi:acyl carrier protein [uncultured Corynebacterium sp.]|uniref:acyl carrier protein n=1 Tax=uncultured Corynebacterium sp. TaxID=159447 RepID=UPI0025D2FB5C|nr:acyl carrier protein [uncultured Corynebacterium sp.]